MVSLFLVLLLPNSGFSQTLWINPNVSMSTDFQFTIQVMAECLGNQVKGVETIVVFDPYLVRLDSITPGPWFTGAPGNYFFWDYTSDGTGSIHFTGSLLDGTSEGEASLATCHFTAIGDGQTPLVFQEVDVRDFDNIDLGFGHSAGDTGILDSAVSTDKQLFGALKAIYR